MPCPTLPALCPERFLGEPARDGVSICGRSGCAAAPTGPNMCGLWVLAEGHPLGLWSIALHKAYYTFDLAEPPGLSLRNL